MMEMFEWLMMAFVVGCGLVVLVKFMATGNVTGNTNLKDKLNNKDFGRNLECYDEELEDEEVFEGVALGIGPLAGLGDESDS